MNLNRGKTEKETPDPEENELVNACKLLLAPERLFARIGATLSIPVGLASAWQALNIPARPSMWQGQASGLLEGLIRETWDLLVGITPLAIALLSLAAAGTGLVVLSYTLHNPSFYKLGAVEAARIGITTLLVAALLLAGGAVWQASM